MKYLLAIIFSILVFLPSQGDELKLFSMNKIVQGETLFIDLSDENLWTRELAIKIKPSKRYRSGYKYINDYDLHKLTYDKSREILKTLKIKQSDKIFVYDFKLNEVTVLKVNEHTPLSSFRSLYGEDDYYFGFRLGEKKLLKGKSYYSHNYIIYIGKENPFETEDMEKINWKETTVDHFPMAKFNREHGLINFKNSDEYEQSKDSWGDTLWIKSSYKTNSYYFSKTNLDYFLYYLTRSKETVDNDGLKTHSHELSYYIQVKQKSGEVIFDSFHKSSESVTVSPFEEETEGQWTGKLFKDRAPIYFNTIESFSFGCRSIYVMDKSVKPINLLCNNRH